MYVLLVFLKNNKIVKVVMILILSIKNEWQLLDNVSDISFLKKLKTKSGTLVLWEKPDRIAGNAEITNERVKTLLSRNV